ncbi:GNAT family N-acetyltransferase [Tropicimonas aquimaris]|uniref:GNAT family N-acetyltransferase n=1 Tax=Tropicimonas aquimaris TaxID=914152 RepID=A0ABW3IJT8_9RHOB
MTPDQLADLHASCFESPRPWSAMEFAQLLDSERVFLCSDEAGVALGRVVADEAELLTLAVAPEARRSGVGRELMARFEATASSRGACSAFLEVSAENAPAIALYETSGYLRAGQRRGYYAAPDGRRIDALLFSKSLT